MCKNLSWRWLCPAGGMAVCATITALAHAARKETVRAELMRLQSQNGLTLISFEGAGPDGPVYTVEFASRSLPDRQLLKKGMGGVRAISPDETQIAFESHRNTGRTFSIPDGKEFPEYRTSLGIIRWDGSDLREYPDLDEPSDLCWSPDGLTLALTVKDLRQGKNAARGLEILNLSSGNAEHVDAKGYATYQCWSPDGKQIVYQAGYGLRVYDIQEKKSRTLTNGRKPTWSPDGSWIAFLEHDGYYAMRPSGGERKLLFKKKDALTALWWSPDSRFVAYVSRNRFSEGLWSPLIEQGRLRVRRLDDNAEDWVANLYIEGHVPEFQWVRDMESNPHVFNHLR